MSDHEPRVRTECDPADSTVTVRARNTDGGRVTGLEVEHGTVPRSASLDVGISPYARLTKRVNCGGRDLCAACDVRVRSDGPTPGHWHGDLTAQFDYPRLSCQLHVDEPLTVELVKEVV